MRQATQMQYAYTTKHWCTNTHTHTHTNTLMHAHRRFFTRSVQVTAELRPIHSSAADFKQQTDISFSRIQTHTMRRSHVSVDVRRPTLNTPMGSNWQCVTAKNIYIYKTNHTSMQQRKTLCCALIISIYTDQHFSFHGDYAAQWTL